MTTPAAQPRREDGPAQPPHRAGPRSPGGSPAPAGPAGRGPGRGNSTTAPASSRAQPDADAVRWRAAVLAQLFLEVETGRRPRSQLRPFMTALLEARLAGVPVRTRAPATLRTVSGSRTSPERYDAVALVRRGARVTALTLSLRRREGKWLLDDIGAPEGEPLPPPAFPIAEEPDAFDAVLDERLVPNHRAR